jgi:hypothetical protein
MRLMDRLVQQYDLVEVLANVVLQVMDIEQLTLMPMSGRYVTLPLSA